MTDLAPVVARVRALKGPDREVDAMVCAAVRYLPKTIAATWARGWPGSLEARGAYVHLVGDAGTTCANFMSSPLTASVDAVLGLITEKLPGQQGVLMQDAENDLAVSGYTDGPEYTGQLARFLLLAFLNAWNTENEHDL